MPVPDGLVGLVEEVIHEASKYGVDFVDARIEHYRYELIVVDNGRVKDHTLSQRLGVGFRVVAGGVGYASTTRLNRDGLRDALERALRSARVADRHEGLAEYRQVKDTAKGHYVIDPFSVDEKEKVEITMNANSVARSISGVVSAVTRLGIQESDRIIVNSEGSQVRVSSYLVGLAHTSVAKGSGGLEAVGDHESRIAGFEFIREWDWEEMAVEASRMAVLASNSRVPKAGRYTLVLDPEMVGLLLHEALGHASEGDLVATGASIIAGRLGEKIAPDYVTIVDDGRVEGGYYVPYDDEGVEKKRTVIVEKGVLKGYLADRQYAAKLGVEPTGNGRVMGFRHPLLVRQTNYFMLPGDYRVEEMIEDVDEGVYVTAKGSKGGEVDPGMGTFTFSAGFSWLIRKGELVEPLRGVSLSGIILEVLRSIDAVGRDVRVKTSVFGGCGKGGQLVRVGDGGPHVRVRNVTVGGR